MPIQANFRGMSDWTAPSQISADTHASSPVLTTISFRCLSPVHVRFEFLSKQICNVEALICHFYKNIKTFTQIHFPRDAHIFRTCTIFYRHYKGLHQMRKDLVLCALIHPNHSGMYEKYWCTWWHLLRIRKWCAGRDVAGGWSPGVSCKGVAPSCLRKFCISWAKKA